MCAIKNCRHEPVLGYTLDGRVIELCETCWTVFAELPTREAAITWLRRKVKPQEARP